MHQLYRIVLTGGPCAGKTTALTHISERLRSLGYSVLMVPEGATTLITGGLSPIGATREQIIQFETSIIKLQIHLEDVFINAARMDKPTVLICDRGAMDPLAYVEPDVWEEIIRENSWTNVGLRDARYDAVIFLQSAAVGAEQFYTTANNPARKESAEQAREMDRKTRDAWIGHSHLRVIDNSQDFSEKMRRVVDAVCRVVGAPEPVEIERKFLVQSAPIDNIPVPSEKIDIEQIYLVTTDGSSARIRRRGQDGIYTYTHTIKRPIKAGQNIEVERPISRREYATLLTEADLKRRPIRKIRHCFLWNSQYFELDQFIDPFKGLLLLEAELETEDQKVEIPPFIKIIADVTDDIEYTNAALAARAITPDQGD